MWAVGHNSCVRVRNRASTTIRAGSSIGSTWWAQKQSTQSPFTCGAVPRLLARATFGREHPSKRLAASNFETGLSGVALFVLLVCSLGCGKMSWPRNPYNPWAINSLIAWAGVCIVAWSQATKAQQSTVRPESEKGVGLYLSIWSCTCYHKKRVQNRKCICLRKAALP